MPQRPCLDCGRLTTASRCARCASDRRRRTYDNAAYRSLPRPSGRCTLRLPGCTGRATTKDHILPVSKGGDNRPSNIRGACEHCNYSRQNRRSGVS